MGDSKSSSDEAIGRPGNWREGRYQQPGKPADQTVETPPATPRGTAEDGPPVVGSPVTQSDYENLKPPPKDISR